METRFLAIFLIISLILVIPLANAQEINIAGKAKQKSVEVTIDDLGNMHVKHIISSSNSPKQVDLIDGTVQNLTITNEEGEERMLTVIGDNDAVMIFPSSMNSIIEYDLEDTLVLNNNIWTLDFRYLQTTTFIVPEKVDLLFANERPIHLQGDRGFVCHGCQMILEYYIDEPKNIKQVSWEDKKFLVEVRTFAEIESFEFDQPEKKISFKIKDSNQFVTTIIPLELLWEPYAVFLDDDKILRHQFSNNGTHVWLNMKPDNVGEITIIGTTVIPEFPVIAPLAIGFLVILVVPLIKKFNRH